VIAELVFKQRAFTLSELTACLATDWGHRLLDIAGRTTTAFGTHVSPERASAIRALCLAQPKFGHGCEAVDQWAWWLLETFVDCIREARAHPLQAAAIAKLTARYDLPDRPFVLHLAPGVGTFEQYVFIGGWSGASADGRRSRGAIGSDLSPAPVPSDQPAFHAEANGTAVHARQSRLEDSLRSYAHPVMARLGDGAPVDYVLPEDFPRDRLQAALRAFADGEGGSICTFTVANPETLAAAQQRPDAYNLVRVRMGGWTEFFIALFPDHQEQHRRRPLYV
jgi:pyruvate-formate lyase